MLDAKLAMKIVIQNAQLESLSLFIRTHYLTFSKDEWRSILYWEAVELRTIAKQLTGVFALQVNYNQNEI